jgi:hypothetical protein
VRFPLAARYSDRSKKRYSDESKKRYSDKDKKRYSDEDKKLRMLKVSDIINHVHAVT